MLKTMTTFTQIHLDANFPSDLKLEPTSIHKTSVVENHSIDPAQAHELTLKNNTFDEVIDFKQDVERYGIAAKTWDASHHLLNYLLKPLNQPQDLNFDPPSPLFEIPTSSSSLLHLMIIDLGSGTGHLPITLASHLSLHHSHHSTIITATDLPEVLPLINRNLTQSKLKSDSHCQLRAQSLVWGDVHQAERLLQSLQNSTSNHHSNFLITCSDLVFFPFLFVPLLRTLLVLTRLDQTLPSTHRTRLTQVLFGYKERTYVKEAPFFSLLGKVLIL